MHRIEGGARTAASAAVIYGPIAAEALGLVKLPKPKPRLPAFAAGVVIGAGAVYYVDRNRRA